MYKNFKIFLPATIHVRNVIANINKRLSMVMHIFKLNTKPDLSPLSD